MRFLFPLKIRFCDYYRKLGSALSHASARDGIFFWCYTNRRHSSLSVTSIYGLAAQRPIIALS